MEQIDEEVSIPGDRGNKHARADFVIWRTAQERLEEKTALIVVECKSDNIAVDQKTYAQGANYADNERAKFFVVHNRRSTKFFKVDLQRRAPNYIEVSEFTEDRTYLRAVIRLSQDTFVSSGASVKCSILFLQKFTSARGGSLCQSAQKSDPRCSAPSKSSAALLPSMISLLSRFRFS